MPMIVVAIWEDPTLVTGGSGREERSPKGVWFPVGEHVSTPGDAWAHETLLKVTSLPYPCFRWEHKFLTFLKDRTSLRHWKILNPESLKKKRPLFSAIPKLGINILWETNSAGQKEKH
jgi:hypothetical protein